MSTVKRNLLAAVLVFAFIVGLDFLDISFGFSTSSVEAEIAFPWLVLLVVFASFVFANVKTFDSAVRYRWLKVGLVAVGCTILFSFLAAIPLAIVHGSMGGLH